MAVEAGHLNLLNHHHKQYLTSSTNNTFEPFNNLLYGTVPINSVFPELTVSPAMYNDTFPAIKSDSGLTYAAAVPNSRKRSREINTLQNDQIVSSFNFLGEDLSVHFQHHQFELDRFISLHTEKVRSDIEDRRKRYTQRIAATIQENAIKRLREKDEEIEKISKMNYALEEKVKSMCVENQIWRDLAMTNEATANALRENLEQVLLHPRDDKVVADDSVSSCCGSNDETEYNGNGSRNCRRCGKEEARVLLLPCRHLCLCTVCGSSINVCPVCSVVKTASVHVNLSFC